MFAGLEVGYVPTELCRRRSRTSYFVGKVQHVVRSESCICSHGMEHIR